MGRKLWTGLRQVNRNRDDLTPAGRPWTEIYPREMIAANNVGRQ
jgi:hypothetical protein